MHMTNQQRIIHQHIAITPLYDIRIVFKRDSASEMQAKVKLEQFSKRHKIKHYSLDTDSSWFNYLSSH